MRSVSEMAIAIVVSLIIISAIYAVRDALLSNNSSLPGAGERPPVILAPPPREVGLVPGRKTNLHAPVPPAQPAVAPWPTPQPAAQERTPTNGPQLSR